MGSKRCVGGGRKRSGGPYGVKKSQGDHAPHTHTTNKKTRKDHGTYKSRKDHGVGKPQEDSWDRNASEGPGGPKAWGETWDPKASGGHWDPKASGTSMGQCRETMF